MVWRQCYLDVVLVPLGLLLMASYHIWLWHKVRTRPETTIIGINAHGRRFWVHALLRYIYVHNSLYVHTFKYIVYDGA